MRLKLSDKDYKSEDALAYFKCPGCNSIHAIATAGPKAWRFNGNFDLPTIQPSISVKGFHGDQKTLCHSFVTDGKIQFLDDCTHDLKGQTVDLPELA